MSLNAEYFPFVAISTDDWKTIWRADDGREIAIVELVAAFNELRREYFGEITA